MDYNKKCKTTSIRQLKSFETEHTKENLSQKTVKSLRRQDSYVNKFF